jgi:hypothetical protein
MINKLQSRFFLACMGLALLSGCQPDLLPGENDNLGLKANPHYNLKLGYMEYTIQELIEDLDSTLNISSDPDGTIVLTYMDSMEDISLKDHIEFEDLQFDDELFVDLPGELVGIPIPPDIKIRFDDIYEETISTLESDQIVDSVRLSNGLVNITATTFGLQTPIDSVLFVFKSLEENGEPFTILVQDLGNTQQIINESIDGYKLNLTNHEIDNTLEFEVHAVLTTDGSPISESMGISFDIEIIDMDFESIFGFIGKITTEFEGDTLVLDFFKEFEADLTYFAEPSIYLNLTTDAGIYAAFQIDEFVGIDQFGNEISLTGEAVDVPFIFHGVDLSEIGQEVTNTYVINHLNSNLDELISSRPILLDFSASMTTNPDDQTDSLDFIFEESKLKANYNIHLPLAFTIENLNRVESTDFEIDDEESPLSFEELFIDIEASNTIPLAADARVVFYDSTTNTEIFDVFKGFQKLVEGAPIDSDGFSSGESSNTLSAEITEEDFDKIKKHADKILIFIRLDSSDKDLDKVVRLETENAINLNIFMNGKAIIEETIN